MFRNYMTNELKITKKDIKEWTIHAVELTVKKHLKETYNNTFLKREIRKFLKDQWGDGLHRQIQKYAGKEIAKQLILNIKENNNEISK